jgi:ankyrin repeat protein
MLAAASGDKCLDCVKVLLRSDADCKVKDAFGNTVLHLVALNGNN